MRKVIVIGGGAAGMFAAYSSAKNGNSVILIEKNEKLGKKIYITGKGRCNVTTSVEKKDFLNGVVSNPKFLFGALNTLSQQNVIDFFTSEGLELKEERGNRIFPASDKASDVTKTLERALIRLGVYIRLNTEVLDIVYENDKVCGVKTELGIIYSDSVIICCGGLSYPLTGSTGDGYKFAKKFGHSVVDLVPSLVGIELKGSDFLSMQGLSLKNVSLTAKLQEKTLFNDFGEMLFTHYGISGPIVLSCSSYINRKNLSDITLHIDLKPALSEDTLDKRLLREFKENNTKKISTVFRSLLPQSLIETVLSQSSVSANKNCSEIKLEERKRLIFALKNLTFKVKKLRPIDEAIITSGGVSVKEINPKTMESKLVKGLFFAGEVLDVDAVTGGYNLQIAFSTGYVAGLYA